MIQKIITGIFLVAMVGAMVAGGVALIRQGSEEHIAGNHGQVERAVIAGNGQAQTRGPHVPAVENEFVQPGQGTGQWQNIQPYASHAEWQSISGTVIETVELVIETAGGERMQIGLGPSHYREAQGFVLKVGDQVNVSGYWEDGEFKAAQVENVSSGQIITLRDTSARPMWSGQGQRKNQIANRGG